MRICSSIFNTPKETSQTRSELSMQIIGGRVSRIAIPVIAIVLLANLPVVKADKFTDCIDFCNKNADNALAKTICYTICAIGSIFSKK